MYKQIIFYNFLFHKKIESYCDCMHVRLRVMSRASDWRMTGFYGEPATSKRRAGWTAFKDLLGNSSLPWLCVGDFNEVLSHDDYSSYHRRNDWQIDYFRDALGHCNLHPLNFEGYKFTWFRNTLAPCTVKARLDMALANHEWSQCFAGSKVVHLHSHTSDHSPILVQIHARHSAPYTRKKKKRFRFEAMWLKSSDCEAVIRESWGGHGDSVAQKIENCSVGLLNWSRGAFGGLQERKKSLEERLYALQQGPIVQATRAEMDEIRSQLEELLSQEDLYWKQRGKQHWYRLGDRNTAYFHAAASKRREVNTIRQLRNDAGHWCATSEALEGIITDYFGSIFQSTMPPSADIQHVLSRLGRRVTRHMNERLSQPYSAAEVLRALKQMHPLKSPGPDGLSPIFYQKFWHIVGGDITSFVLDFLNTGNLSRPLNYTHVVLIPKVKAPESITQFRPISLCNVAYKIASKVLANRLRATLSAIISPSQSAFIKGRLITDNILLAYEVHHALKNKPVGREGLMSIKLDMSKAFDRVEWNFLYQVLLKLGYDPSFADRIFTCVSTASLSFILNGDPVGELHPKRGLRQGDPLSPYLFILCSEVFSSLIQRASECGNLTGISVARTAPPISHLFFADDTLLFGKASISEARTFKQILQAYQLVSGQQINFEKSAVVFSRNVPTGTREAICALLQVAEKDLHGQYLGLPMFVGSSKREIFASIKDRVWQRVQGWKERSLSKAGKEVLIKAVLQAIPTYAMSCFKLPDTLLGEIQSLMASFWWGDGSEKRKIHWASWERLSHSKCAGGLGFRDLTIFNSAMLAKQAWRLLTNPSSLLGRVLKARYYPTSDFLEASLGVRPSFTWRSILVGRAALEVGLRKRVGSGRSIRIWHDRWLPRPSTFRVSAQPANFSADDRVSTLIDQEGGRWHEERVKQLFSEADALLILNIPLSRLYKTDLWVWHYAKNGRFTVKSAYHALLANPSSTLAETWGASTSSGPLDLWRHLWKLDVPNKVKHFAWRVCTDTLPTPENLLKRHVALDPSCPFCAGCMGDLLHILCMCPRARQIWDLSTLPLRIRRNGHSSAKLWFRDLLLDSPSSCRNLIVMIAYGIWNSRNKLLFQGARDDPAVLVRQSESLLHLFHAANKLLAPACPDILLERNVERKGTSILFDAGFSSSLGVAHLGFCIVDSGGNFIAGAARKRSNVSDPATAEAMAASEAVHLASSVGIRGATLYGDSHIVISSINDEDDSYAPFGPLIHEIRLAFSSGVISSARWICRSQNSIAHSIAAHLKHRDVSECFWPSRPDFVSQFALDEFSNN